jgi:hypothetical protein
MTCLHLGLCRETIQIIQSQISITSMTQVKWCIQIANDCSLHKVLHPNHNISRVDATIIGLYITSKTGSKMNVYIIYHSYQMNVDIINCSYHAYLTILTLDGNENK